MEKRRWFSIDAYEERIRRVKQDMVARELDCLLLFQPESVTYLSGFFTRGYTSFQFLILPLDGSPIVVCRDMEAYYLETTYAFSDRFLWTDSDDKNQVMIAAIKKAGFANARLGLEKSAWQMNATRYQALAAGLPDAELLDIRDLVGRHTLIKSPAEIAYQRRAGKAAEAGMAAGAEHARVGVSSRCSPPGPRRGFRTRIGRRDLPGNGSGRQRHTRTRGTLIGGKGAASARRLYRPCIKDR